MLPTIPDFALPAFLGQVGRRLPQWPHGLGLCMALNGALALRLFPEDALETLAGRIFEVQVEDTGAVARFTFRNGYFQPLWRAVPADLIFTGHLAAYLKLMARQEDPDTLFFNRQLTVEGDTELGLFVKNMLDSIEWPDLATLKATGQGWLGRLPRPWMRHA